MMKIKHACFEFEQRLNCGNRACSPAFTIMALALKPQHGKNAGNGAVVESTCIRPDALHKFLSSNPYSVDCNDLISLLD